MFCVLGITLSDLHVLLHLLFRRPLLSPVITNSSLFFTPKEPEGTGHLSNVPRVQCGKWQSWDSHSAGGLQSLYSYPLYHTVLQVS